ncbi:hypothetical protein K443DRAFT_120438 [Laccaria amethystina LaAM-08-1]|uniref:Mitochondrial carrier n=1 Tax=Laccaria amethystina LaAM-08-1 TaxID=1095629 RepID=A0A0C9Y636_9AGAR|nr:hypothetical protein K443DRAFT_120438 [Laccaria amethystina LaAM-08-1]
MSKGDGQVELNPTIDFVAGTVASPAIASKYTSTFQAITTIIRDERFIGLYKGITSPLATVALMNGLVFASYHFFMKLQLEDSSTTPSIIQIALAGAGSGIISSIITTPTELIKIRQQSLLTETGTRQVALQILKESGIKGLYRGIAATALRDIGYGAYFAAYEATCRYLSNPAVTPLDSSLIMAQVESGMTKLSWPSLLLAGGVAGIGMVFICSPTLSLLILCPSTAGWLVTFPFDVVKTRVQGSTAALSAPAAAPIPSQTSFFPGAPLLDRSGSTATDYNPYRTTMSTIIHSYHSEGINVFFHGLAPTLIRAIPVNMVTFATFEAVVHALS